MLYDSTFNKFINIVLVLQVQKKKKKMLQQTIICVTGTKVQIYVAPKVIFNKVSKLSKIYLHGKQTPIIIDLLITL